MSQRLDTLRLLTTSMHNMCDEVWAVQRETPEDTYLHGALDAVFQALCNACDAAETEMRREVEAKKRLRSRARAHRRYVEGLAPCACGPDGVCAECYPADAPGVLTHPCCTGTAVLAGRACPRCSS
jgi:hypothetical protein